MYISSKYQFKTVFAYNMSISECEDVWIKLRDFKNGHNSYINEVIYRHITIGILRPFSMFCH